MSHVVVVFTNGEMAFSLRRSSSRETSSKPTVEYDDDLARSHHTYISIWMNDSHHPVVVVVIMKISTFFKLREKEERMRGNES